jgi:prepilin-type N-terminal cleavage/methylation domain-containing protein
MKNYFKQVCHCEELSQKAFTLAEVLITLGIIGVVGALTMPVLIQKIDDRANITRWKKMASVMSQAYNKTVNDTASTPVHPNWEQDFIDRFMSNFTVIKKCNTPDTSNCYSAAKPGNLSGYSYWQGVHSTGLFYQTLAGGSFNSYNLYNGSYLLNSGEILYWGGTHGGPWVSVDVNGFYKGPNVLGRDLFSMKVVNGRLLPLGAEGTFSTAENGTECECSKDAGLETGNYLGGGGTGVGEVLSGGCCSSKYLYK